MDGEKARVTVRRWIAEACERAVPSPRWPDFTARALDVFGPHPEVHDYVLWRFEPVTTLLRAMREEADPATKLVLIDVKDGWLGGCDRVAAAEALDGLILCAYDMMPLEVADLIRSARASLGPDKILGTGFRVFFPEMKDAADVAARAAAARHAGVDSINFYNYGLIPKARLDWVAEACRGSA